MYFAGQRKTLPASRYGDLLALMDATGWSYDEALSFYERAPEDLYREFEIRLWKKGVAAEEKAKEIEAMQRITHGPIARRRGGSRRR